jgi:hypothetical protein
MYFILLFFSWYKDLPLCLAKQIIKTSLKEMTLYLLILKNIAADKIVQFDT